jgi:hypothetical protein
MILLDADLLLLDIRYPRDVRFSLNERLLKTLQERGLERGITLYALLEVIGILSFNLPTDQIRQLYTVLPKSEHRIVAHFVTGSEIPLNPPLAKGETKIAPFAKGGRAPARGDFVRHCAKPVWSDLEETLAPPSLVQTSRRSATRRYFRLEYYSHSHPLATN